MPEQEQTPPAEPPKRKGGRPKKDPAELVGTVTGYSNHGLRDPASRAAWAEYIAKRRRATGT